MGRAYIHLYAHLCYTHLYKKIKDLQIKIFAKKFGSSLYIYYKKKSNHETSKRSKHELLATLETRYVMRYSVNNTRVVPMDIKGLYK